MKIMGQPKKTAKKTVEPRKRFNILIVGQRGRLEYEAVVFVASLRQNCPDFLGQVFVAEPQEGELWTEDPRMSHDTKEVLKGLGAQVVPFESKHFGQKYPYGNKIEALQVLPEGKPFVFFDTDTLVMGDIGRVKFNFKKPAASMKREGTWPKEQLYWPGYAATWKVLYDRFGLDFESSLDLSKPDEYWERYLYFNAGWLYGADPHAFGARFLEYALSVRDDTPQELKTQKLNPWLDQIVLPLVIHSFGGGRPPEELSGLDGDVTCHYRVIPLCYARERDEVIDMLEQVCHSEDIRSHLEDYEPFAKMVLAGHGRNLRGYFDRNLLPMQEREIRLKIREMGLWIR